jgi:hypothetical protein
MAEPSKSSAVSDVALLWRRVRKAAIEAPKRYFDPLTRAWRIIFKGTELTKTPKPSDGSGGQSARANPESLHTLS